MKKDRGHIKKKIEKYIQEQRADRAKLYNAISEAMPGLRTINGLYGWL